MVITKQRITCTICRHVFDAEVIANAPISVVAASLEAVRCEKCGGHNLGLGGGHGDAPPISEPVAVRASWWLRRGEVGTSSRTIYSAFAGDHGGDRPDIPYDPDDYSRCRKLFELIPEWRADLSPIVARFPWFKPFVERWDEMDRLWDEEAPKNKCPRLYKLMKIAEVESIRIRYPKAVIETSADGSLRSMRNPA